MRTSECLLVSNTVSNRENRYNYSSSSRPISQQQITSPANLAASQVVQIRLNAVQMIAAN